MASHAKIFGASNSTRWLNCAAAPAREADKPNTSSPDARQGTAAHELGERCLRDRNLRPADFLGTTIEVEGHQITVDEEMVEAITSYVDFVLHVVDTTGGELFVETRVSYRDWLPAGLDDTDGFGTADVIVIAGDEIGVFDLKYGKGEKVDAKDNDQLRLYALGAYAEHSILNDFKTVRVGIIQPRKGGVSEWTYEVEEVLSWGEWVKGRAQVVLDGCDVGNPGKKTCRWCRAKAECPELKAEALQTVFDDFPNLDEPKVPALPDLVACYQKVDLIEGWLRAIKERMYEETLAGAIPDYKIVEGRKGARGWEDAEKAEATLKSMRLKKEEMYDFKLISPTSAEKLLKDKPRSWKRIESLITQPSGKLTVAHISDPRKPFQPVADDFADIPADADLFKE